MLLTPTAYSVVDLKGLVLAYVIFTINLPQFKAAKLINPNLTMIMNLFVCFMALYSAFRGLFLFVVVAYGEIRLF